MTDTTQIPGAARTKRPYVRRKPLPPRPQASAEAFTAPEPQIRETVRETRSNERAEGSVVGRDAYGRLQVFGRDGKIISRTRTGADDTYFVPEHVKPEGWDYNWKANSVTGQPMIAHQTMLQQNGWTPVPATRHDGMFMPAGYNGPIERDGLILMERPAILSEEARAEDARRAKNQVNVNQQELKENMPRGFTTEHVGLPNKVQSRFEPPSVSRPKLEIAPDGE